MKRRVGLVQNILHSNSRKIMKLSKREIAEIYFSHYLEKVSRWNIYVADGFYRLASWFARLNKRQTSEYDDNAIYEGEVVHDWFGLSYAQYLTIPRLVLEAMPSCWQERFVDCLEELDANIDWRPENAQYFVTLERLGTVWDEDEERYIYGPDGEIDDPLRDYRHGSCDHLIKKNR